MKHSIKKIIAGIGFLLLVFHAQAQDVITLKNGNEIQSKILDIGSTEIKYKKFENIDGPSYTILKAEVFMIKYKNGTKDVFNETTPAVTSSPVSPPTNTTSYSPPSTTTTASTLKKNIDSNTPVLKYGFFNKGKFSLFDNNGNEIKHKMTNSDMEALLKGNQEALNFYHQSFSQVKLAKILSYTGIGAAVVGGGLLIGGVAVLLDQVDKVSSSNLDQDISGNTGLWVSGGIFLAAGVGLAIATIPISVKAIANNYKTVGAYNRNQRGETYLDINLKHGLGLAYHF